MITAEAPFAPNIAIPEIQQQRVDIVAEIARQIDGRLSVKHEFFTQPSGPTLIVNGIAKEKPPTIRHPLICVYAGSNLVTSFPANKVFMKNEINAQILEGIRHLKGAVISL